MTNKLDLLSKIIIATGQINYMASRVHQLNEAMKIICYQKKQNKDLKKESSDSIGESDLYKDILEKGISYRNEVLMEAVTKLAEVMNELGDLMNGCDATTPIDERVTKVSFDILVHGRDDMDEEYDQAT